MHELSLVEEIFRIATEQSAGRPVLKVVMRVGALTCVMPEALQFCFDSGKADTVLAGAMLVIEPVAGRAHCNDCGNEFAIDELYDICRCGSFDKRIVQGQELIVQTLEFGASLQHTGD